MVGWGLVSLCKKARYPSKMRADGLGTGFTKSYGCALKLMARPVKLADKSQWPPRMQTLPRALRRWPVRWNDLIPFHVCLEG